jgi:acyl-CoA-dependent ceramide synthase
MWHFFLVFLIFIWILICIWFAMICNVVWKVLTGDAAEDTRSDDEEESEEAEDETPCVVTLPSPALAQSRACADPKPSTRPLGLQAQG